MDTVPATDSAPVNDDRLELYVAVNGALRQHFKAAANERRPLDHAVRFAFTTWRTFILTKYTLELETEDVDNLRAIDPTDDIPTHLRAAELALQQVGWRLEALLRDRQRAAADVRATLGGDR